MTPIQQIEFHIMTVCLVVIALGELGDAKRLVKNWVDRKLAHWRNG